MNMDNKKDLPKRKDIRLKNYDYSSPGAYFVTICTKNRKNYFWNGQIDPQRFNWRPYGGRMIKQFKGAATKNIGASILQKSYIEHVIRDKKDYETRANYIFENPLRWYYDELYAEE